MNESVLHRVQRCCDDPKLYKVQIVQRLWSDYGEIARYYSPKLAKTIIVKQISPPTRVTHPRGWHSSTGHQRKLTSYQVEAYFYQDFGHHCDRQCKVADLIAISNEEQTQGHVNQILILEDLDHSHFKLRWRKAALEEVKLGVRWLAYFHGRFVNVSTKKLWPIGSYWHLATRQDEYRAMANNRLKDAAEKIDLSLNQASYQTLLHGDAKLANFCFAENANDIAAVDFQYTGKGVGVKDLMYFLGSCLQSTQLYTYHEALLDDYFSHLKVAMKQTSLSSEFDALEQQWRRLYPLVWADFNRFLQGWSPGHKKINDYMTQQTELALVQL